MRVIEANSFSGYGGLRQVELPAPQAAKDRVLVRVTAAGVTPLDHTILSGGHPRAKAPLVLGNEGAGVIEDAGDSVRQSLRSLRSLLVEIYPPDLAKQGLRAALEDLLAPAAAMFLLAKSACRASWICPYFVAES